MRPNFEPKLQQRAKNWARETISSMEALEQARGLDSSLRLWKEWEEEVRDRIKVCLLRNSNGQNVANGYNRVCLSRCQWLSYHNDRTPTKRSIFQRVMRSSRRSRHR